MRSHKQEPRVPVTVDPYVVPADLRRLWVRAVVLAGILFFGVSALVGPTQAGRAVDRSVMTLGAIVVAATVFSRTLPKADARVKFTWSAYGAGIGLYSVIFALDLGSVRGSCAICNNAGFVLASLAWLLLVGTLAVAIAIAYPKSERGKLRIEVLDAAVIVVSASTALWMLHSAGVVRFSDTLPSPRAVELAGLPLVLAGIVFVRRCISTALRYYKFWQLVFLGSVAAWIALGGLGAETSLSRGAWALFAAARAFTLVSAVVLPLYAVREGAGAATLMLEGPEDRPITDVTVAAAFLAALAVGAIIAGPRPLGGFPAVPSIGLTISSLVLVARLALTSRHHEELVKALEIATVRHRELVEGAFYGLLEVDWGGCVVYANGAAAKILGADHAGLVGRRLDELLVLPASESPSAADSLESIEDRWLGADPWVGRVSDGNGRPVQGGTASSGVWAALRKGSRVVGIAEVPESTRRKERPTYVELVPSSSKRSSLLRVVLRDVSSEVQGRLHLLQLSKDLLERDRERAALTKDLLETAESERYSLASQLHDGPVQHLALVALKLDLARKKLDSEAPARGSQTTMDLSAVLEELEREAANLRFLVASMQVLKDTERSGLRAALESVMQAIFESEPKAGTTRWEVRIAGDPSASFPTGKLKLAALSRACQGMALDAKFAGASVVEVEVLQENESVTLRFSTDAPLHTPYSRGVSRAKTLAVRLGGTFRESSVDGRYVAELSVTPEDLSTSAPAPETISELWGAKL
jgi:PAS domain-containing protein